MFRPFIRPSSCRIYEYIRENCATEEFDCEGEASSLSHISFMNAYVLSDVVLLNDGRQNDRKMS